MSLSSYTDNNGAASSENNNQIHYRHIHYVTHNTVLPISLLVDKIAIFLAQQYTHSQTRQAGDLPGSVVLGDAHVQSATAVAQVLGSQHGALLANQQRR